MARTGDRKTTDDNLPAIYQGGDWRVMGLLPPTPESLRGIPTAKAKLDQWEIKIRPESEWGAGDLTEYQGTYNPDQNGRGSCACEAVTFAGMDCLEQQTGQQVIFNPWVLYALVTSRDSGSIATENIKKAQEVGFCPMADWDRSKHGWPSLPSDYKRLCEPYRPGEVFIAETLAELVTCVDLLIPGCVGVTWFGGGGHEIRCTRWDKSKNGLVIKNSWSGDDEGNIGKPTFWLLPRRMVEAGLNTYGPAVFIRSMKLSQRAA